MTSQLYNLCLQNSGAAESGAAAASASTPESLLHIFLSPLPPLLPASRDTPVCSSSNLLLVFSLFSFSLVFPLSFNVVRRGRASVSTPYFFSRCKMPVFKWFSKEKKMVGFVLRVIGSDSWNKLKVSDVTKSILYPDVFFRRASTCRQILGGVWVTVSPSSVTTNWGFLLTAVVHSYTAVLVFYWLFPDVFKVPSGSHILDIFRFHSFEVQLHS